MPAPPPPLYCFASSVRREAPNSGVAAPRRVSPITRKFAPSPAVITAPASLAIKTPAAQSHGFHTPATPVKVEGAERVSFLVAFTTATLVNHQVEKFLLPRESTKLGGDLCVAPSGSHEYFCSFQQLLRLPSCGHPCIMTYHNRMEPYTPGRRRRNYLCPSLVNVPSTCVRDPLVKQSHCCRLPLVC